MRPRNPLAEIVAYNRPLLAEGRAVLGGDGKDLTREALGRKLEALARSPFSFFRGTFHLMAADLLQGRVAGAEALAPEALIVGDLHLENFGVYRGATGALCFEVNDFDDVGLGPADLDVKRLCTSALLLPGLLHGARLQAAKAIAKAWADAVERIGGRFPVGPFDEAKAEPPVKELLGDRGRRTREALIAKAAPDKGHRKFAEGDGPAKYARIGKPWAEVVERALLEYLESLKQLKVDVSHSWDLLDVGYRFKGTGSLGRLRFSALLGKGELRRIVEVKEARQCALDEARGRPESPQPARVQTAAIRRLQGDPWPRVAGTHLGKLPALVREVQPEEEKLGIDTFAAGQGDAGHERLFSYARQCGEVTARLHCRASAPALLDDARFKPQECARAAVEFAEAYAQQVEADQRAFLEGRTEIARSLGLQP